MPEQINARFISLRITKKDGRLEIPEDMAIDKEFVVKAAFDDIYLENNHDGTFNKVFLFKPISIELK